MTKSVHGLPVSSAQLPRKTADRANHEVAEGTDILREDVSIRCQDINPLIVTKSNDKPLMPWFPGHAVVHVHPVAFAEGHEPPQIHG